MYLGSADLVMGTFSKSFASIGGFVAGDEVVIDYIKHRARHFMFTAAMPPAAAATVLESMKIIQEEPEHLANLTRIAKKMAFELNRLGFYTLGSTTPIIPLLIGDDISALAFSQKLYENGVFATPVVKPAVPDGCALIRTSYMATHTESDLDYVLTVLEKLGKSFGILGNPERAEQMERSAASHFGNRAKRKIARPTPVAPPFTCAAHLA